MGLMDFFRKKPAARPTSADSAPADSELGDLAGLMGDLGEPRCAHYSLAHYALRMAAFEHPVAFLGMLGSPDARDFLSTLLESVAEHCSGRGETPDFTVDDLRVHRARLGGRYPAALIEFPTPRAITEVYFVCAALEVDLTGAEPTPEDWDRAPLRYITLENGFSMDGTARTALCEWTSSGAHQNYGDGPEPQLEAFAAAAQRLMAQRGDAESNAT